MTAGSLRHASSGVPHLYKRLKFWGKNMPKSSLADRHKRAFTSSVKGLSGVVQVEKVGTV